jgi:hypothetical protein
LENAAERFVALVREERGRHKKRLVISGLVAALIAVVLYETQWLNIRSGLGVLLAGQICCVCALLVRNRRLAEYLDGSRAVGWFQGEEVFIVRLALFETACQVIGFLLIGYALWKATGSLAVALAIGIVYPASLYFGMTRRRNATAVRALRRKRDEFLALPRE